MVSPSLSLLRLFLLPSHPYMSSFSLSSDSRQANAKGLTDHTENKYSKQGKS